jgi:hypothetical protein
MDRFLISQHGIKANPPPLCVYLSSLKYLTFVQYGIYLSHNRNSQKLRAVNTAEGFYWSEYKAVVTHRPNLMPFQ